MFNVSASLEHACLQSFTKVWTAFATGFRGRSISIILQDLERIPFRWVTRPHAPPPACQSGESACPHACHAILM